ncbi:MAG: hypothetical protein IPI87_03550 [Betaproteobacteria bacterium]|nr:hypothetical protein [Betaproteobacteria bacterium]
MSRFSSTAMSGATTPTTCVTFAASTFSRNASDLYRSEVRGSTFSIAPPPAMRATCTRSPQATTVRRPFSTHSSVPPASSSTE